MNHHQLTLAAKLLRMAAETFGNHGCNDFDVADCLMPEAAEQAIKDIDAWSRAIGDLGPNDAPPKEGETMTYDWLAMHWLADMLEKEAEK